MRLFMEAQSERGKPVTKSGNEHIDIDITADRISLAKLTARWSDDLPDGDSGWGLYDEDDECIKWIGLKSKTANA